MFFFFLLRSLFICLPHTASSIQFFLSLLLPVHQFFTDILAAPFYPVSSLFALLHSIFTISFHLSFPSPRCCCFFFLIFATFLISLVSIFFTVFFCSWFFSSLSFHSLFPAFPFLPTFHSLLQHPFPLAPSPLLQLSTSLLAFSRAEFTHLLSSSLYPNTIPASFRSSITRVLCLTPLPWFSDASSPPPPN